MARTANAHGSMLGGPHGRDDSERIQKSPEPGGKESGTISESGASSYNSDVTESGAICESDTKDSGVISMAPESCSTTSSIAISMESGANSSDIESAGAASLECDEAMCARTGER